MGRDIQSNPWSRWLLFYRILSVRNVLVEWTSKTEEMHFEVCIESQNALDDDLLGDFESWEINGKQVPKDIMTSRCATGYKMIPDCLLWGVEHRECSGGTTTRNIEKEIQMHHEFHVYLGCIFVWCSSMWPWILRIPWRTKHANHGTWYPKRSWGSLQPVLLAAPPLAFSICLLPCVFLLCAPMGLQPLFSFWRLLVTLLRGCVFACVLRRLGKLPLFQGTRTDLLAVFVSCVSGWPFSLSWARLGHSSLGLGSGWACSQSWFPFCAVGMLHDVVSQIWEPNSSMESACRPNWYVKRPAYRRHAKQTSSLCIFVWFYRGAQGVPWMSCSTFCMLVSLWHSPYP